MWIVLRRSLVGGIGTWAALAGCLACNLYLPPTAIDRVVPARTKVDERQGVAFWEEDDLDDAVWMEVPRAEPDGPLTGYLSVNRPHRGALVILVHGASFYTRDGSAGTARELHRQLGWDLHGEDYLTWSLATPECGAAYGQDDLAYVLDAVDWVQGRGDEVLGVDRVYLIGYSNGGAVAVLANQERSLDGVVSLSGPVHGDQLVLIETLAPFMEALYPDNEGACQVVETFERYGPLGSAAWERFDVFAHLGEMQSPMLFIHGLHDTTVPPDATWELEAGYLEGLAAGEDWPRLEFAYVPRVPHHAMPPSPEAAEHVIHFLAGLEPERPD